MHQADLRHKKISLQNKLERIFSMRSGSRLNWDQSNYLNFLSALGNPQHKIPPVIHVGGTNGKGSIVATLRSLLEAGGYRVHAYISPHLMRANERIYLAGADIDDEGLEALIDEILPLAERLNLTFFEVMTGAAFLAFTRVQADILLLEVGMGGRLDCTNVVEQKLVSLIGRISMDHTEYLGDHLTQIACEKAGIMKKDVPCVVSYQGQGDDSISVSNELERAARDVGAEIFAAGRDWDSRADKDGMVFRFREQERHLPLPALEGLHQIENAGAALAALTCISDRFPVSEEALVKGLRHVHWPGRLQRLNPGGIGLPDYAEIWLDAGHNDSAGAVLATQSALWDVQDFRPLFLLFGMLDKKDVRSFLAPLLPYVSGLFLVPITGEPTTLTPEKFREKAGDLGGQHKPVFCQNFSEGLQEILKQANYKPCRILIAGSVYLAGDVLSLYANKS